MGFPATASTSDVTYYASVLRRLLYLEDENEIIGTGWHRVKGLSSIMGDKPFEFIRYFKGNGSV